MTTDRARGLLGALYPELPDADLGAAVDAWRTGTSPVFRRGPRTHFQPDRYYWLPPGDDGWTAFVAAVDARPTDDLNKLVFADWLDDHDRPVDAAVWRLFVAADRVPWFVTRDVPRSFSMYGPDRWHWFPRTGISELDLRVVPARCLLADTGPLHHQSSFDYMQEDNFPLCLHRSAARAYLSVVAHVLRHGTVAADVAAFPLSGSTHGDPACEI